MNGYLIRVYLRYLMDEGISNGEGIGLIEEEMRGMDHRNDHSLDEEQQLKLLFHVMFWTVLSGYACLQCKQAHCYTREHTPGGVRCLLHTSRRALDMSLSSRS
ncbi:hypothetical protein EVAR_84899_1 [Eumeta japonica]|uniref:Uncharacterized protein n=1 Tax=Eumeta variegata TaxID=151549 RepID=A0A4C1YGV3_EUMVA|nr:hypothetical protein EVAR_84899_1 [Eumeta japonica]